MEKDTEEFIDGQDGFDKFRGIFDPGWVCGRQQLGSDSASDTLKSRHDRFAPVDGGVRYRLRSALQVLARVKMERRKAISW